MTDDEYGESFFRRIRRAVGFDDAEEQELVSFGDSPDNESIESSPFVDMTDYEYGELFGLISELSRARKHSNHSPIPITEEEEYEEALKKLDSMTDEEMQEAVMLKDIKPKHRKAFKIVDQDCDNWEAYWEWFSQQAFRSIWQSDEKNPEISTSHYERTR
jgi:restriction endonuclease